MKQKTEGLSKYARKVKRRRAICKKMGIPVVPFPILWMWGVARFEWQQ